jgi:hypothetical protein
MVENLWPYWTATFIGISIIATILGKNLAMDDMNLLLKYMPFYMKNNIKTTYVAVGKIR